MIVLFNLNKYVGGGEILTIRFAQYLHDHNIAYTMLAFGENCYIADQAKARGLNITPWPIEEDSVAYMNDADRKDLLQKMTKIFEKEKLIYPFSFCFRDLYNSLFLFTRFTKTEVRLSTGIYHPEDVLYLSSLSLNKSKIINFNKKIIHSLAQKNAVLFPLKPYKKLTLSPEFLKNLCKKKQNLLEKIICKFWIFFTIVPRSVFSKFNSHSNSSPGCAKSK